jgi:hypothetical protein
MTIDLTAYNISHYLFYHGSMLVCLRVAYEYENMVSHPKISISECEPFFKRNLNFYK